MSDLKRIGDLTAELGLEEQDVEPVGWYKGKFALGLERRLADKPSAKYVNVTAINPTPLGEGKTVTSIGLSMGLNRIGKRSIVTLRQPSQGPLFGIKGGGAGGGKSKLFPADEINLHFTGDMHAVGAATNLLAALIDNHLARKGTPIIDPSTVTWQRCVDVCDRGLRNVQTAVGEGEKWIARSTSFDLTPASEIMAILALATSLADFSRRIGRILVGLTAGGDPVFVDDLGFTGALTAVLRDAIRPNLAQTVEGTPAVVHAGPFANIAHGNSSVLGDLIAVRLTEYVVTESGFGADCGAEKFFNIKCRASGLRPDVEVVVCTVRALKLHSGRFTVKAGKPLPQDLLTEDFPALRSGAVNLQAHLGILRQFGVPTVVAINRFPTDTDNELAEIRRLALEAGATDVAISTPFAEGGAGAEQLAEAVVKAASLPNRFQFLYNLDLPAEEKLHSIATKVYGGEGVEISPEASRELELYRRLGFGELPVCIAKTQYSLSHDPKLIGRPRGFRIPIRQVRLAAGAGFLYALAGEIQTMPGLPSQPAALRITVDPDGTIHNLL